MTGQEVRDLITGAPLVIGRESSLRAAAQVLEAAGEAAAVVGQTRRVDGVFSEHSVVEAVARGFELDATPVQALMTPYFASIDGGTDLEEAKQRVRSGDAHFVAITDEGQVIGLLSAEEVLRVPSPAPA